MPPLSSILILGLFYLLLLVEFFLPSAGVIGAAAAVAAIAAIVTAFLHSMTAGVTVFALVTVTTPIIIALMIHVWPKTAIGRKILNRQPGQVTVSTMSDRRLPNGNPLASIVNQVGIAVTDLLPAGLIQVDGQRLNAVSIGVPIDAGSHVFITQIQAGKIQVRPALSTEVSPPASEEVNTPVSSPELLDADLNELGADDLPTY
jgi:membrane-bound ClpP family serine protease